MGSVAFIGAAENAVNDYKTLSNLPADELHKLADEAQVAVDAAGAITIATGNNPIFGSFANGAVVSAGLGALAIQVPTAMADYKNGDMLAFVGDLTSMVGDAAAVAGGIAGEFGLIPLAQGAEVLGVAASTAGLAINNPQEISSFIAKAEDVVSEIGNEAQNAVVDAITSAGLQAAGDIIDKASQFIYDTLNPTPQTDTVSADEINSLAENDMATVAAGAGSVQVDMGTVTPASNAGLLTSYTDASGDQNDSVFGDGLSVSGGPTTNVDLVGDGTSAAVTGGAASVAFSGTNQALSLDGGGSASPLTVTTGPNDRVSIADYAPSASIDVSMTPTAVVSFADSGQEGAADQGGDGDATLNVTGDGGTVNLGTNDALELSGSDNTVNLGDNSYVAVNAGTGNVVTNDMAGDNVDVTGNTSTTIDGSGGHFGVFDTGAVVYASNETANTWTGIAFDLVGNGDQVSLGTYSSMSVDGTGDTINAGLDTITLDGDGTSAVVDGGQSTIDLTASDQSVTTPYNGTVDVASGLSNVVINGSYETINEGSDDNVQINGSYDTIVGDGSDETDYNGSDFTGSGGSVYGGSSSGGGGSGSSGFAAGSPRQMNVVSQYDLGHGFVVAARSADASRVRSEAAITASSHPASATPSPFNGIKWAAGSTITWSFAEPSSEGPDPVSGSLSPRYRKAIEQALRTWSAATGITFKEVPASGSSDLKIGWGDFDTSTSGLLGFTSHARVSNGTASSILVRLEDPKQDALVAGADGQLIYSGTQTTLEQVALHEIGHVLGLAETSDPNSIMYPLLGAKNTTLDATDLKDVGTLYGRSSPSAVPDRTALLVQTMAAFGASHASNDTPTLVRTPAPDAHTLAANPLH